MTTWICELNKEDVSLIATLAHAFLQEVPDQEVATQLLEKLREQTENTVSLDPQDHKMESIPDHVKAKFKPVTIPTLYMPGHLFDE